MSAYIVHIHVYVRLQVRSILYYNITTYINTGIHALPDISF